MSVRSAQAITKLFTTRVFGTGVATNADSTPEGTVYVNGTADAAAVTVTNITTGVYKAAVTLPTLAIGDLVELRIAATVSTIADNAVVWNDFCDITIDSSGRVDLGKWIGTAPLELSAQQVQSVVPATQHVIVDSGTVTTVTNQLTGSQIATAVWSDTTAGDFTTSLSVGKSLMNGVTLGTGLTVARCSLTDTVTTYTGNTVQTGDNYAIVSSGTYGNSALKALIDAIQAVVGNGSYGNAALLTALQNIQNGTYIAFSIPQMLERPDTGTATVNLAFVFADETGVAKNLDSGNPALTLVNDAGTDLSSRLSGWSNPATGKYTISYTSSATDTIEGMHWEVTGTVNGKLRRNVAYTQIVDTTAVNFTSTDRTQLLAVYNKLPVNGIADETILLSTIGTPAQVGDVTLASSQPHYAPAKAGDAMALTSGERTTLSAVFWNSLTSGMATVGSISKRIIDYLTGDIFTRLGVPSGASTSADIAAVQSEINNIQTRLPVALVGGKMDATASVTLSDNDIAGIAADTATAVLDGLGNQAINITSPFTLGGALTITTGDSYIAAMGTSLRCNLVNRSDLIGLIPHLIGKSGVTFDVAAPAIVSGTETMIFGDLSSATTLLLGSLGNPAKGTYQIRFFNGSGEKVTETQGILYVNKGLTA